MIEKDTVRLLRECDAGAKMGIESINGIVSQVESPGFREALFKCRDEHEKLEKDIRKELDSFGDEGKDPAFAAKTMSYVKSGVKLAFETGDSSAADLITDGCNTGVKSLSKYLNRYKAASEESKDIARRLIASESGLAGRAREFL